MSYVSWASCEKQVHDDDKAINQSVIALIVYYVIVNLFIYLLGEVTKSKKMSNLFTWTKNTVQSVQPPPSAPTY